MTMNDTINVCICIPPSHDNRPADEQALTLEKFRELDPRLQFHYAQYIDRPEVRALRGQPQFDSARALIDPLPEALRQALAQAHIVLCVDLPFDMDQLAPNLRWVQSVGAGVAQLQHCGLDKLDGVMLTNGAGIAAAPIAEFVLARILSHWKLFDQYRENQQKHQWTQVFGRDLAGSTLGIVGYGAIGHAIATRAKAWGMKVVATRKHLPANPRDPAVDHFYPIGELHTLLSQCDAVALTAAETPETYHLFNAEAFAAMPRGSYFCNISRGSLVEEPALIAALVTGHLSGASIDVATVEPIPADDPLWDTPNLAISPHCSPTAENFSRNAWLLFYDNMARFLAGKELKNLRSTSFTE